PSEGRNGRLSERLGGDQTQNKRERRQSSLAAKPQTSVRQAARYHVRTGEARHRRRRGNEQKMVDVQLAVDTLSMASRGLFASCTLITGDLDFKPLVSALVDMGVHVTLLYPEDETNDDLKAAADQSDALTIATLQGWISDSFPQKGQLPKGSFNFIGDFPTDLIRLAEWRDEKYGNCIVVHDTAWLRLITERSPQNPATHRLELNSLSEAVLRAYAKDVFNLAVPEW
ncbi:MAG: NYN domain-containing protein, partial [Alphaproteobacteria bacterium]|nr:NYN domain-containing protein [Alphaproteobacteria bacterium]